MFCRKCGEIIDDGGDLCQTCRKQSISISMVVKEMATEAGKKMGEIGKDAMDNSIKEVQKAVRKKANQTTNRILVKVGLKNKTPLDKVKDVLKKVRR